MLTRRMQIQAIANHLANMPDTFTTKLCKFQEPWRTAYQAITMAPPGGEQEALIRILAEHPERDSIIGAILAQVPGSMAKAFPSLQEIASELSPVEWLWPGWIPRGMLSLLGATPGAGKSYLALDLACRIISGDTFPDGANVPRPGANVVYVDAENVPQIHNERAQSWNMDRSKLYLMLPSSDDLLIDLTQREQQDELVELIYATQPELVIIDSLGQSSSRGENTVEDVREILSFLNVLGAEFDCGLLLIHHLRKRSPLHMMEQLSIDDFRGSSHIIAIARSVMGLSIVQTGPELDRNGPRRLEVVKANLGRYPDPIGVEFVPLHPSGAFLSYGEVPHPFQEPSGQDLCGEWLLQTLAENGPMSAKDILELAKASDFSRAMVYRARSDLGDKIRDTLGSRRPGNQWELALVDDSEETSVNESGET